MDSVRSRITSQPWFPWVSGLACTAVVFVIYYYPTKGLQDALLWLVFLASLRHVRRLYWLLRSPIAWALLALLAYTLAALPLSQSPKESWHELSKNLDSVAVAFAIPLLCRKRQHVEGIVFFTAAAFTAIVTVDLVRLVRTLGSHVLSSAHSYEPFALIHSNISSMAAGIAALSLPYFLWRWRRNWRAVPCALAIGVLLAYLFVMESRGPQLAFLATIAAAGVLLPRGWKWRLAWGAAILIVLALAAANLSSLNPRFAESSLRGLLLDRDKVWAHTWSLAQDHLALGHGFGRDLFSHIYYASTPPASPFHFPHPHQYWLFILFSQGVVGVALHAAAWISLSIALVRLCLDRHLSSDDRLLPATLLLVFVFLHVYGMADWPAAVLNVVMLWFAVAGLVLARGGRSFLEGGPPGITEVS